MEKEIAQDEITSGGRALNAVIYNKNLNGNEKALLLIFGSQLNFKNNFREKRYVAIEKFCELLSWGRDRVFKTLKSVIEKGYLLKYKRFSSGTVGCLPSDFAFGEKLFAEYEAALIAKRPSGKTTSREYRPPLVANTDHPWSQNPTEVPSSNSLNKNSLYNFSPSEKEKLETEGKDTFEAQAEPEPEPRLSERIAQERERQSLTPKHTEAKPTPKQTPISKPQTKATSHAKPNPGTVTTLEKKRRGELAKERREINEAIEAAALIFRPSEFLEGQFFDILSVKAAAKIAYENYGLSTIISIRDDVIALKNAGRIPFDACIFLDDCKRRYMKSVNI